MTCVLSVPLTCAMGDLPTIGVLHKHNTMGSLRARHGKAAHTIRTQLPVKVYVSKSDFWDSLPGTSLDLVWSAISVEVDQLLDVCEDYCRRTGVTPAQLVLAHPRDVTQDPKLTGA